MRIIISMLSFAILLNSCSNKSNNVEEIELTGKTVNNITEKSKHTEKDVLKLEEAYAKLIGHDSIKVAIEGVISDMCQKDGCWMTIKFDSKNELLVFLEHPDSVFANSNPIDKNVIIEGYLYSKKLEKDELEALSSHIGLNGSLNLISKNIITFRASTFQEKL